MARPPRRVLEDSHPELADALVDQSLRRIATSSSRRVAWRCSTHPDHVWETQVFNRTQAKKPTGCPFCSGKKVLKSFNDCVTVHPERAELFLNPDDAFTHTPKSNKKAMFHCGDPAHDPWQAPVARVIAGSGCPQCAGRIPVVGVNDLATTHPELTTELADPSDATRLQAGSGKTTWLCPTHGTWEATVSSRTHKKTGCPVCSGHRVLPGVNDLITTHPTLAAECITPEETTRVSSGSMKRLTWKCPQGHTWIASVVNRTTHQSGCPVCSNIRVVPGVNDLGTTHPDIIDHLKNPIDAQQVTAGTKTKLTWVCSQDSSHTWNAIPAIVLDSHTYMCPQCNPHGTSAAEREIVDIIHKLCPEAIIRTSVNDLLPNRRECDIVVDDHHLAIEFNGVYWHCESVIPDPNYHAQKTRDATAHGYTLLHIWEDDWRKRKNIVIRALAHRLGATNRLSAVYDDPTVSETHYARTLTAQVVTDASVVRKFWNTHHLQGAVGCDVNIALVDHTGDIKALLGIGKKNHGSTATLPDGTWDVQRYATACSVPGGFSKLLAYAEKHYDVQTWVSFSHDDISAGQMYLKTGFTAVKSYPPSYSYVGTPTKWIRKHRLNYTLQRFKNDPTLLYKDGWSEHDAALANGLYRIYNAGVTKWTKTV